MPTITQEPVNIGPVPRCVKMTDGDAGVFMIALVACASVFILAKLHR